MSELLQSFDQLTSNTLWVEAILHDLVTVMQNQGSARAALASMRAVVGNQAEQILRDCEAHAAYADDNHFSLLWHFYKSHRQTLFELLAEIRLATTSQDTAVEEALGFLRSHWTSRRDWLDLDRHEPLDLSWVPDKWWKLVTGSSNRHRLPTRVDRRHFEVCLFSQIVAELKSGDLCIEGSDQFADYRRQLVPWAEYERNVAGYGEQVGLPVEGRAFVARLQEHLARAAVETDRGFPNNEFLRIEDGEPVLGRLPGRRESKNVKALERRMAERIEPLDILDVLVDTENWLNWTRFFGPISGHDAKLDAARARYVATTFCYGCNLGPSQTARSLDGFDRRQIAWVDQRHVTEENLDEAITALINAYNRFWLPKLWGSGKHASADGMKWNLYEQNLLSEYHIRYGGYGGIGYYHVSDTYVALFSHFIPCGVWEAVYILDGPVRSGSLCGRRCLMLLLTCLFENPMSRRMVAEYAHLHLLMPTTAGAGCFPPAIAPRAWQSLPHALAQLGRCRYLAQQREQRIHLDQLADCHHLPLHVVEQLLVGNLLRLTCLVRRQVGAHDLQRVVHQQAERHLKQYRLRHRADQVPQREHVGDLVENRFDSPAALIRRQHRLGRILHLVQQIRDHTDLFAVTQMLGDPTHVLTASLLNLAQPTPLLNDPLPFGVAALPGRPGRIGDERRIGAVADEEMAPGFQHLLRETQVAVKSVQHHHPLLPWAGRRRQLRQQDLGEGRFTGFAVEMADHRHRQTRPQVQAHRRTRPRMPARKPRNGLSSRLTCLIALPSAPKTS